MQISCFKRKVTFDSYENIILNEDQGAYHYTYLYYIIKRT